MTSPVYATREDVMRALDVKLTARNSRQIDRALESASRGVESLCHRRFYPEIATRYFDWPNSQSGTSWRLWLDDNELASLDALVSGGVEIPSTDYNLEPNRSGPPYNRIEIKLSSSSSFGGGDTHQRDIGASGLWAGAPVTETTVGATVEALDASETAVDVDAAASAELGVGSILRVDSERMIVTGRTMLTTGQNLGGTGLTAQQNNVTVTVTDGTAYTVDETILIDSERMLIVDIAGNTLIVQRAWDGTVLAAHTVGADIYAPRTLTVRRGALGTTADTHANGSSILRWEAPGLVRDLTIAETLTRLTNEQAGYARTRKQGDGGEAERAKATFDLPGLREQVYAAHGRKARVRAV